MRDKSVSKIRSATLLRQKIIIKQETKANLKVKMIIKLYA